MKKQILVIGTVVISIFIGVGGASAQDGEKMDKDKMKMEMKMDMAAMKKSPQHGVMMAYRQNMLTFAKTLRDMAKEGKLEDVGLARNAFAEIKRSMKKMDEIHNAHMSMMSAEKLEMMKPMMEKMKAENAIVKEEILALETALQMDNPNAMDVEKHASALVLQLEKMDHPDKKMDMPDKMKM